MGGCVCATDCADRGGTAGHVTPNLALIEALKAEGWDIHYIGTQDGIERELVERLPGVTYHSVPSGKLRRYFDLKNFTDPFKVLAGSVKAARLIGQLKPDIVFSKADSCRCRWFTGHGCTACRS